MRVPNFDKVDATSTSHEWLTQELLAAASNVQVEGDDATFTSLTPPVRMGDYTQILSKTFLVSDTLEAVKKAGRGSEVARGAMVKMRELKRDLEYAVTRNQAATSGGTGTGRSMAGIETWIAGYYANAAVGTTNAASTAVVPTAGTNATTPSTTKAAFRARRRPISRRDGGLHVMYLQLCPAGRMRSNGAAMRRLF